MNATTATPSRGADVAEMLAGESPLRQRLLDYAARRFRIDRETAEDLVQETAVEAMRSERPVNQPEAFLVHVFHLRCCHHVEKATTRRQALGRRPPSRGTESVDPWQAEDAALALRQGFSRLTPACQELLRAYYLEGHSLRETAERLSLAHSGVFTLIARCLRRLMKCFVP